MWMLLKYSDVCPNLRRVGSGWTRQIILVGLTIVLFGLNATAAMPVAWWSFDDVDNPGLDSIGGNNAYLIGNSLPTVTAGHAGWGAISLNGNGQFLAVPDAPALDITGPLTIMVWAKANTVNANYPFVYKASGWDDGQMAYALDLRYAEGFYPRFWVSSDGRATGYNEVISPVALQPGGWHLIAGVYDRRSLNIYVDGQLQATTPYDGDIYAGKDPLYIGWDWNTTWNGALDDIRLFNVALSADQILGMYQSELPSVDVHLVGSFGRVPVGQIETNEVAFTNLGTNDLAITATLTGPNADRFQLLAPVGSVILHPGASNAITTPLIFRPGAEGVFLGSLIVTSGVSAVQIPLAGQGVTNAWHPLTLDLQTRDPVSRRILHTTQTINSSQMAILVVDVWDSHPDPGEASATAGLIPMINQTLDAARAQGIPVIFCPNEVPLPAEADHSIFGNLPGIPQTDNGFAPPLPPYTATVPGDMVPIPYHEAHAPVFAYPTAQHPHLVVKPGDLASLSRQEILNYCSANSVNYLLYMGAAANMCVSFTREMSMIPMQRYCGLQTIMVRNLTASMSLNGRINGGNDDSASNIDGTMTPNRGHREVTASLETYICPSIDARQLMQHWEPANYANLISSQSNLMTYWRMDSQASYQEILDMEQLQSCWWNRTDSNQMAGLNFSVPGVVAGDPDTAVQFNGASTLLVSPIYRIHIPTNSPLMSLSATNFALELWVRIGQLNNSNQWFYAHDNGTSAGVDVLLGINARNRFEFVVGRNASGDGFGDVVESSNVVTQADVDSQRWFHLVAEHDLSGGNLALYVNGVGVTTAPHNCTPVSLNAAPHFGSRGLVQMGADGYLSSLGFEGFNGALDEVAIYSSALDATTIRTHYNVAGVPPLAMAAQAVRMIDVLTLLTVTNTAAGAYPLTYELLSPPSGATIDNNGIISWSPSQAQGGSTYLITTVVTDGSIPPLKATNSFSVIVSGTYLGIDLTDPAQATADFDGDGLSNLLEYSLGNDPRNPADATSVIHCSTVQVHSGQCLTLSFKRRPNAVGLQYIPEVSADNQTWYSDTAHIQENGVTPLNTQFDWVTVQDLTNVTLGAPRFIRLRVVEN
ncbi:MAG TPA: LamG-like jellyroll fold domain-containing protein [Patescibacteria group bacterium]|jgi:nicotinamidase-related amidase|nr:LamG-like jellyroll fold domain-containing protein [Patescibacteria group bacterium]